MGFSDWKKKNNRWHYFFSWLIAIPGAFSLFFSLISLENIQGGIRELLLILISAIVTFSLFLLGKGYIAAVFAQGLALYMIFFYRFSNLLLYGLRDSQVFTSKRILAALLVWFSGIFLLLVIRVFSKSNQLGDFRVAFHLSAILFLVIYALILYHLFFLQREAKLDGNRLLNLIPLQGAFAVYWPHILSGQFGNDIFIQFFGNLFILLPLGFYLAAYARRFPIILNLLIPILFAGLIETTQYVFNMGAADVDDFWMNVLGAWGGSILFFFCAWIRKKRTKNPKALIF